MLQPVIAGFTYVQQLKIATVWDCFRISAGECFLLLPCRRCKSCCVKASLTLRGILHEMQEINFPLWAQCKP